MTRFADDRNWSIRRSKMQKELWKRKAEALKPEIHYTTVKPTEGLPSAELHTGDSIVLDLGNHYVGYFSFHAVTTGSHPDAPALIKIKFCESKRELHENAKDYRGWISKGWIQEEVIHIDLFPGWIELPRRYACRYIKLEVIDLSSKYALVLDDARFREGTSARDEAVAPFQGTEREGQLDRIAIRTLRSCMQDFFEDGPKRDRRLWIGDLRLQALANASTFQNYALVKRCLYLFACCTDDRGQVPACLFTEPEIEGDDSYLFDYSLFFIAALCDYVEATGDTETGRELLPVAEKQWELSKTEFDENDLIRDRDVIGWCFLDWNLQLNKQGGAQFVYLYCLKKLRTLYGLLGVTSKSEELSADISGKEQAAKSFLYDEETGLFVSGRERQLSWATQSWAVISGIFTKEEAAELLLRAEAQSNVEKMVTPYMHHVYLEALLYAGMRDKAYRHMLEYWGGMADDGADTFYELFDPEDPDASPYGSPIVNSFCHAWSCTPTWFMRSLGLREV